VKCKLAGGCRAPLLFETVEEIYARVASELRPGSAALPVQVTFCRFTSDRSVIRLRDGCIRVRIPTCSRCAGAGDGSLAYLPSASCSTGPFR
jgi:hypothetical protein